MAIVGILYLPTAASPASTNQTPANVISAHLSDLFPTQTHTSFHLEHRLFVSTSSLLPHADRKRTFTHLFNSSRSSDKVFVGTGGGAGAGGTSTVTIPTSSLEPFTALLSQKLQARWAPRQFLVSDNGASVVLSLADDARWKVSLGDLRLSQSRVSGSAAGQLRGLVLEIQYETDDPDLSVEDETHRKKYETLFHGLVSGLFEKLKLDLRLDDAKIHLVQTSTGTGDEAEGKLSQQSSGKPSGYEVAELYMEVLRGSRG